jgi:hypothetical protein
MTSGAWLRAHVVTPIVVEDSMVPPTGARVPARGRMRFQGSGEAEPVPLGSGKAVVTFFNRPSELIIDNN